MLNEFYDLIASDMVYKICNSSKEENKLGIAESFAGPARNLILNNSTTFNKITYINKS